MDSFNSTADGVPLLNLSTGVTGVPTGVPTGTAEAPRLGNNTTTINITIDGNSNVAININSNGDNVNSGQETPPTEE